MKYLSNSGLTHLKTLLKNALNNKSDTDHTHTANDITDLEKAKSLEYDWNGTELGIRVEDSGEYEYVDLKGESGVHVGSTEPTHQNVWIDTSGSPVDIPTKDYVDLKKEEAISESNNYAHAQDSNLSAWVELQMDRLTTQKILWSGGYYMNASHTVTLSENISSQNNGIILVFSGYSNSAVQNYNWSSFYIPKEMISLGHGGNGWFCPLGGIDGLYAYKYIYIHDNKIVGHANNVGTKTAAGVTYNNSSAVLRYVIGV